MMRTERPLGVLALCSGMCFTFLVTGTSPALASQAFDFQKIAVRGEAAPGTEPGTVFGPLVDAYFISVPALDQTGAVSFVATLEGPSVTATNRTGVWSFRDGALARIARAGTAAPEVAPGVFTSFPFDFALVSPAAGGGRMGFSATVQGAGIDFENDDGVWDLSGGTLRLFTREGAPAPGLASGITLTTPISLEIDPGGHAFLRTSIAGPGVTTLDNEGFWSDRSGSLALVLREGDTAPGAGAGVKFGGAGEFIGTGYSFGSVDWSPDSRLALQASVTGPNVTTFNNETIYAERGGVLTLIAREGQQAPGMPNGDTFGGNSVLADFSGVEMNALGQIAFNARVGAEAKYLLYSDHRGSLLPVAQFGDPAPGTAQTFGFLTDARLSDGGRIAFRAILSGSGQWPPLGLWWDQPGAPGELQAVALPGGAAPGRPGVVILSVFTIHGFTPAGQLVFRAELDDPAFGARSALYFVDATGIVSEVAVTGDLFDVAGSAGTGADMREISAIQFGDLNPDGEMALRLDFVGGGFGIYRVTPQSTTSVDGPAARGVELAQNAPNPFARATRFDFALARPGHARMTVFDASGRVVRRLLDEARDAGPQSIAWDGRDDAGQDLASGRYWVQIEAGAEARSIGIVKLRP
ncbi:MAG: DUF7453 family protein [Candidatus Eiseniibacteriota bacterium]